MGKGASNSTDSWNGLVDDVRFYGTAASGEDAARLYAYTGPEFRDLTISAGEGGTVSPSGTITTVAGYARTIQATPDPGYEFDRWVTTNGSATVSDRYSETMTVTSGNQNAEISAHFVPLTGSVHVHNIPADAEVFAYAANGWIGRQVSVGEGTVSGLPSGTNRITIRAPGRRTVQASIAVTAGGIDTLSVGSAKLIPLMFTDTITTTCEGNAITTPEPSCAIFEDFDNDTDNDLLLGFLSGSFAYYRRDDTGFVAHEGPVTVLGDALEVSDGIRGVRSVDWNADGKIDLVVADTTNTISVYRRTGEASELIFDTPTVLYQVSEGDIAGFDIVDYNLNGFPDFIIGFENGEIKRSLFSGTDWNSQSWEQPVPFETDNGSLVGAAATSPCMVDYSGDGVLDLVSACADGSIHLYTAQGNGLFRSAGEFNAGGRALHTGGRAFPSLIPGTMDDLPVICLGADFTAILRSRLLGDFFEDMFDIVDINDFAVFGDAFGADEGDAAWETKRSCNLDVAPNMNNEQCIDACDLTRFGDVWGAAK